MICSHSQILFRVLQDVRLAATRGARVFALGGRRCTVSRDCSRWVKRNLTRYLKPRGSHGS